ncbi:unnamed protein product [marine sediment metagenome]|uniref:Uncharacterized protein n=1 Tax=marine sediment metagenome TaxID=412755 RepID=X1RLC5_9ZZZZ
MDKKAKVPGKITDFKGHSPRVTVTRTPDDSADVDATNLLLQQYTDKDGFHCPRCPFTTTNREEAVYHLAEELNKAIDHIGRRAK